MRVLHLVTAAFGENGVVGGAERYALELARSMSKEVPTTLAAFGDRSDEQQIGQLRMRVLGPSWHVRGQRANPLSMKLFSEIRKADIVHCHQQHIVASSLASLVCRMTARKAFVSDLGGGGWDISSYVNTDGWYRGHLHISEYSRKIFGHSGKPWAHVIYGGVDTDKFCPDDSSQRNGKVLYVGRLLPHKGIDDLIKALPEGMSLEIIGRPYDTRYHEDLLKLAAGKLVNFRTDCTDAQIIEAYRRSLCIVLPSVYKTMYGEETSVPELLGQTLLEGMACGTPAICTDVASMPEVVKDQVTGFVVPPNNPKALRQKLLWLGEHPEGVRTMGEAARNDIMARFTWGKVVRRCLDIYSASAPGMTGTERTEAVNGTGRVQ